MSSSIVDKIEALFDEEKFVEARSEAEAALKNNASELDEAAQKQLKLFIRKCNLHAPPVATEAAPVKAEEKKEKQQQPQQGTKEETTTPVSKEAETPAPTAPVAAPRPAPLARHEWYQTSSSITFTFYVKERTSEHIKLKHTNRSLEVAITLPGADAKVAEWIFDPFYMPIKNYYQRHKIQGRSQGSKGRRKPMAFSRIEVWQSSSLQAHRRSPKNSSRTQLPQ